MSKLLLRKQFRDSRASINEGYRHQAALWGAALFCQQPFFHTSKRIAAYLAIDTEFNCAPLIEAIWSAKKECYLPVLVGDEKEKTMQFVNYVSETALHFNRYKILEPIDTTNIVPVADLDIILLPLIAFDRSGHRLGSGGGYYDRTLCSFRDEKKKKPLLLGVAFSIQEADHLPHEEWDVSLDGVITEKRVILC